MEICENLVLLAKPVDVAHYATGAYYAMAAGRRHAYDIRYTLHKDSSKDFKHEYDTEAEAWRGWKALAPEFRSLLETGKHISYRALYRRFEMFDELGEAQVLALENKVLEKINQAHLTVIEALGGTRLTRAKLNPTRLKYSKCITPLWNRSRVQLPYEKDEVGITTKMLPSVLSNDEWSLRVSYVAGSNEAMFEAQQRIETVAYPALAAMGIVVKDTTIATMLEI